MDKNENITLNSSNFGNDKRMNLPEILEKNEDSLNRDSKSRLKGILKSTKDFNSIGDLQEGEIQPILPHNMSENKMLTESDLLSQANLKDNSVTNNIRDEIKSICSKIFLNFAKFSVIDKEYFLSQQNLLKIFRGINLIDEKTITVNEIDILFKKVSVSGKRLNLNQFLNLIILISKKIDKEAYKKDAKYQVVSIVKTFFEPYSKYIEGQGTSSSGTDLTSNNIMIKNTIELFLQNFNYDFTIISLINSVYLGLRDVYLAYFSAENKPNPLDKITQSSFQALLDFGKDFEVLPCFCSVNQIVIYWNVIIKISPGEITRNKQYPDLIDPKKDLGQVFTLSKFASMLIYLSVLTFYKYNVDTKTSVTYGEKLIFFLEKLENSAGFRSMEKKLNKFHTKNTTLIPPKDIVLLVNPSLGKESNFIDDKKEEESKKIKEFNERSKVLGEEGNDLRSLMSIIPEAYMKLESKLDSLKEIFVNYCKYGSKHNTQKLGFSSYLKFLRDCDLIYFPTPKKVLEIENKKKEEGKKKEQSRSTNKHSSSSQKKNDGKNPKDKAPNGKSAFKKDYKGIKSLFDEENEFPKDKLSPVKKLNVPRGKILESDVLVIFYDLTGYKNFDNSEKIRSQFDKNTGVDVKMESNHNVYSTMIDPSKSFKVSHENSPLKMDFCLFVKSFEFLARKLHPNVNLDHGFSMFLEKDIKKVLFKKNDKLALDKKNFIEKWNSLKRDEIVDILKDIHPLIFPYYESYCNNDALVDYEKFLEFYKDFLIFPSALSTSQLKILFFSLSDIFSTNTYQTKNKSSSNIQGDNSANSTIEKTKKTVNSNKFINYDLFLESLAITAIVMKLGKEDFNDVQKILYLLEIMNCSEAIKKCKLKTGQFFYSSKECVSQKDILKAKYQDFYKLNITAKMNASELEFNELFD